MGFPTKNNKYRNPSHACTPQRNPSPPLRSVTSAFGHVPRDQHPIWSDLRVPRVSCSYVFVICLVQTPALPEIRFVTAERCLLKYHQHLHTHAEKLGDLAYLLKRLLSDKHSHMEQELSFFLGIASLQRKDCPFDDQPIKLQNPARCAKNAQIDFSVGP